MEFTLLFAAVAGVAPAWFVARRTTAALGAPPLDLADRILGAVITGLFVGRIVAMLEVGINPLRAIGDILIIRGGVSTVGATAGALLYVWWTSRGRVAEVTAALSGAALVGLAGWSAGCVFRGACAGTPAPWGRHLTELYAAALFLAGAALVVWLRGRLAAGAVAGAALAWAGAVRLATEPIRPSLTGGPRAAYALAVVVGLVVVGICVRRSAHLPYDRPED